MTGSPKTYQKYFIEILPKLFEVDFTKCPCRLIFESIPKEKFEIFKRLPYYYDNGVMLINKSAPIHYKSMQGFLIALWSDDDSGIIETQKQLVKKYGNITWEDAARETDGKIQRDMILNILSCEIVKCKNLKGNL